jgi:predicted nucleic acid-binding protein
VTVKKIVVDTSVIADHVMTGRKRSILREISGRYFCYTTVFHAIELFSAAKSLKERQAVQQAMDALKVLGINPKSAKNIASVVTSSSMRDFAVLAAAVCIESGLPLATLEPKRYAGIRKLKVVDIQSLIT